MKTIITVILYNKNIDDSETLKQLVHSSCSDCVLNIVNNGPQRIELKGEVYKGLLDAFNHIYLDEYIDNKPLSWIYNDVLEGGIGDRFIFLDDDSHLDPDFFRKVDCYYNENVDLQLPLIYETSNKELYYPLIDKMVCNRQDGYIVEGGRDILSIGSGLVIYKSLIEKFSNIGLELFDRKFALYGVDFSLFRRMNLVTKNRVVNIQIVSFINHSLSRTSTDYSESRHQERLYDSTLSIKFYSKNKFISILRLFKLIAKEIMCYRIKNVCLIIETYLAGKHPRCN